MGFLLPADSAGELIEQVGREGMGFVECYDPDILVLKHWSAEALVGTVPEGKGKRGPIKIVGRRGLVQVGEPGVYFPGPLIYVHRLRSRRDQFASIGGRRRRHERECILRYGANSPGRDGVVWEGQTGRRVIDR